MKQAVFLVTSLAGVKKLTFKQKIKALLDEQAHVRIVLAMIKFNDYDTAERQIKRLFVGHEQLIELITLAKIVAQYQGVPVPTNEQFDSGFEQLPNHRFEPTQDMANPTVRYIQDDEIVAEVQLDENDQPLLKTKVENHQPVQTAVYENAHQFGLLEYEAGQLNQALLLNATGQLIFRFIRHQQPVTYAYTMGRTSKLAFTNILAEVDDDRHVVYQATEQKAYFEVVDYQNYQRFDSVEAFYAQLLNQVVPDDALLFIDLNDNPKLTPYLPQQLIFNY